MYKNRLWLYVLSVICLAESGNTSQVANDDLLSEIRTAIMSRISIENAIDNERRERMFKVIHTPYIPFFVRCVIPLDLLIEINFNSGDDLKIQTSNLIRLGLLLQHSDIDGLSLSDKNRAIAECYMQAARINITKLNISADHYDLEVTIDVLTSTGQLLFWAVLKYDNGADQQELLPLSISFFKTAESLLHKINQEQSIVFARKLTEEIAKARYYQQRLSQQIDVK